MRKILTVLSLMLFTLGVTAASTVYADPPSTSTGCSFQAPLVVGSSDTVTGITNHLSGVTYSATFSDSSTTSGSAIVTRAKQSGTGFWYDYYQFQITPPVAGLVNVSVLYAGKVFAICSGTAT